MAQVQFQSRCRLLQMGRTGHGVSAAQAACQHKFHILPRVVFETLRSGQLQAQAHHVVRQALQRSHAHGQFFHGEAALVRHLAHLQHHIALGVGAAGQHIACSFFGGAQGLVLVCVVAHAARDFFALARTAGAVFAAIRQADAVGNGGAQNRFIAQGGEAAPTGLYGNLKAGIGAGHGMGILKVRQR